MVDYTKVYSHRLNWYKWKNVLYKCLLSISMLNQLNFSMMPSHLSKQLILSDKSVHKWQITLKYSHTVWIYAKNFWCREHLPWQVNVLPDQTPDMPPSWLISHTVYLFVVRKFGGQVMLHTSPMRFPEHDEASKKPFETVGRLSYEHVIAGNRLK